MASLKLGLHKNGGAGAPGMHMCLFTPKYGTPDYFLILLCHVTLVFGLDTCQVHIIIIGVSVSEPHTSELNRDFYYFLSYVVLYVFDAVI